MEAFEQLHMNSGTGEASYSSHSSVQKKAISIAKPMIYEAIHDVFSKYCSISKSIAIADMGCSSGPNTLLMVSYVMDAIYKKHGESGQASPELFVFLNDLPSNDFNNLFRSLQGFFDEQKKTKGYGGFGPCFIAGVPGTFYGRLFPSDTLHFVHSSYTLHWLSQVPPGISQSNKGNIYLAKSSPPTVFEAYLTQFKRDFWVFLRSRSEEVVEGGRMVLTILGRRSEDPCSKECAYISIKLLAIALNDLVSQGMVGEEKLDSLNLPNYFPSPQEVKSIIQNESSFTIDHLQTIQVNWDGEDHGDFVSADKVRSSNIVAGCIRAVYESSLVSHFGQGIIDELFRKFRALVEDHMSGDMIKYTNIAISLKRNKRLVHVDFTFPSTREK